jgi:Ca-activated chloride channel family protein
MLTDGRNNTGSIDPETAAGMARTFGIKVYTVGVGTEGKVPFLVDTIIGKQAVYQRVDLDEAILKKVAGITGGTYFKATNTEALAEIYRQIDQMEKTTIETKEYTEYRELFHPFLLCGLAFLLLEVVLTNTRLRRIP